MPDYELTDPQGGRYRVTAPEGMSEDEVIRRFQRSRAGLSETPGWGETALDVGARTMGGFNKMLASTAMAPLDFSAWLTGTQGKGLQGAAQKALSPYLEQPEAETSLGRYGEKVGEAAAGILPATGVMRAISAAPKLGATAFGRAAGQAAERPFSPLNLLSAAGAGTAQQATADMGAPPLVQNIAGLAGGLAAPLGAVGAAPAARYASEQILGLGTRMGLPGMHASAFTSRGGAGGGKLSRTDAETFQLLTDTLRAEGATDQQIDDFFRNLDWSRRFHSAGSHDVPAPGTPGGAGGPMGPPQLLPAPGTPGGVRGPMGPPQRGAQAPTVSEPYYSEAPLRAGFAEFSPGTQKLLAHEVRHNLESANVAKRVFAARQHGYAKEGVPEEGTAPGELYTKYDERLRTLAPRDTSHYSALDEAQSRALRIEDKTHHAHGRTAAETDELILADQKAKGDADFAATRALGEKVNLQDEAEVTDAFAKLVAAANRKDLTPDVADELKWMVKQYAPSGTLVERIGDFDRARRVVSERIGALSRGVGGKLSTTSAAEMADAQRALVGAARRIETEGLGAAYGKGIDDYGDSARMLKDIQLGRDIFAGKVDPSAVDAVTGREAFNRVKLGYHGAWQAKFSPMKSNTDITKQAAMDSMKRRREMAYLIERGKKVYADRPERLEHYEGLEAKMIQSREAAQGGSQTAGRMADDQTFDTLHTLSQVVKGAAGNADAVKRLSEYALHKVFGLRADVSANLTRMLLSNDPAVHARLAAEVKFRLGSQTRVERFNEVMRLIAREAGRTGTRTGTAGGLVAGTKEREQR